MTKAYVIFVRDGFSGPGSGHLLHLFISKENAKSEMSKLKKDYPDHIFFVKSIKFDDA